jgi:hypothetical protein
MRPRDYVAALAAASWMLLAAGCGGGDDEPSRPQVPARPGGDFVGIVAEEALAGTPEERARVLDRLRSLRVGVLRQAFRWREVEVSPGRYEFARLDGFVADAAQRGIEILPILFDPPSFRSSAPEADVRRGTYPPRRPEDLGRFGAALARRYGPDGSFWDRRPRVRRLPIRAWQVWNEPNIPTYWPQGPDPAEYVRLLRDTGREIKRVDPRAEIVGAGLSESRLGMPFEEFVRGMYDADAGDALDTFALHPFARTVEGTLLAVEGARELLGELGDDAPIWITEFAWASGGPPSPFTVGEARQAALVRAALTSFARRREDLGIRGAVYFNWRDSRPFAGGQDFFGLHTGLLRRDGTAKPALGAFGRATRAATMR